MRMTSRQRLMHGFIEYIHNYVMGELEYKYVMELEKKKNLAKKKRLAKKKKQGRIA